MSTGASKSTRASRGRLNSQGDSTAPASRKPDPSSRKDRRAGSKSAATGKAPGSRTRAAVRIGVISDNHGRLDPMVLGIFAGVDHIIHAGDIGDPEILSQLSAVAPVTAVAGNIDPAELAATLPREATGEVSGVHFIVGHKRKRLEKRLAAGKVGDKKTPRHLIVFGHGHMPSAQWVDGSLLLNPGTAGAPYEEDDDPTVAIVETVAAGLAVLFVPLDRRAIEGGSE